MAMALALAMALAHDKRQIPCACRRFACESLHSAVNRSGYRKLSDNEIIDINALKSLGAVRAVAKPEGF